MVNLTVILFALSGVLRNELLSDETESGHNIQAVIDQCESMEKAMRQMECVWIFETRMEHAGNDTSPKANASTSRGLLRRDLKNQRIYFLHSVLQDSDSSNGTEQNISELTCSPSSYISVSIDPENNSPHIFSLADKQEEEFDDFRLFSLDSVFFGKISFGENQYEVLKILNNMDGHETQETMEGKELFRIDGEYEKLAISAWFDPSLDYSTARLEIRNLRAPNTTVPEEIVVEVKDYRETNNITVPREYVLREVFPSGIQKPPELPPGVVLKGLKETKRPSRVRISHVVVESIDLVPTFTKESFGITTDMSNDTRVSMQDAPHLDFVWRDGEIVPLTDEAVAALRGQKFLQGPGSARFWMFVVGLILFAAIVVTRICQRKRAASANLPPKQ